MFWFMDRLKLSRLFERWAEENDVRVCGAGMLAYLQIHGLLNEEKAREFVKGSGAA
jgi:hypothetical protein